MVYIDRNAPVDRVVFTTYAGHARGGFASRGCGCCGLDIAGSGQPWLGGDANIALANVGSDVPGLLLGTIEPVSDALLRLPRGFGCRWPARSLAEPRERDGADPEAHSARRRSSQRARLRGRQRRCLGALLLSDALDITIR